MGMLTGFEGEKPQQWRSAGTFVYHQTAGLVLGLGLNVKGVMESRRWERFWPFRQTMPLGGRGWKLFPVPPPYLVISHEVE